MTFAERVNTKYYRYNFLKVSGSQVIFGEIR